MNISENNVNNKVNDVDDYNNINLNVPIVENNIGSSGDMGTAHLGTTNDPLQSHSMMEPSASI